MNNLPRKKGEIYSHSYKAIHFWLKRNFGNPLKCERCGQLGKKNGRMWNIEWALQRNKEYQRVKDNFIALCKSCHRKQDMNDNIRKNISTGLKNYYAQ